MGRRSKRNEARASDRSHLTENHYSRRFPERLLLWTKVNHNVWEPNPGAYSEKEIRLRAVSMRYLHAAPRDSLGMHGRDVPGLWYLSRTLGRDRKVIRTNWRLFLKIFEPISHPCSLVTVFYFGIQSGREGRHHKGYQRCDFPKEAVPLEVLNLFFTTTTADIAAQVAS